MHDSYVVSVSETTPQLSLYAAFRNQMVSLIHCPSTLKPQGAARSKNGPFSRVRRNGWVDDSLVLRQQALCLAAVGRFDLQFRPVERLLTSVVDKPTSGDYRSGGVSAIKENTDEVHD